MKNMRMVGVDVKPLALLPFRIEICEQVETGTTLSTATA